MTLRFRLVAALTLLLAVGLAVFGASTLSAYSRSQYDRLDLQLQDSIGLVSRDLIEKVGLSQGPVTNDRSRPSSDTAGRDPVTGIGRPPIVIPPGTYAELRDASNKIVSNIQISTTADAPTIPTSLPVDRHPITVPSVQGSNDWRLVTAPTTRLPGYRIVVAIPTSEVAASLRRLIVIEVIAATAILAVLGTGSWLILRKGLRPLENMAIQASAISAGNLADRVTLANNRSEVGQLGLALNTMLGGIEQSFIERQATEDRLRQFLADASHELRTPLTSIQGFAELSRMKPLEGTVDFPAMMFRIQTEAARMNRLVEDLLLLARLDQTLPRESQPVDLAIVVSEACSASAATGTTNKITLVADSPVVVLGDQLHLHQALTNLITNAVKHTPPNTAIDVTVARNEGQATVTVRDHGEGLTPEALTKVFERFWQLDPARVGAGSGLGLAIVTGIAHEHGGTVSARNHPDGGAEFLLVLPINPS